MTNEELTLIKNIVEKTKRGKIRWSYKNDLISYYQTKLKEFYIELKKIYSSGEYKLIIRNSAGVTSYSTECHPDNPLEELWKYLDANIGKSHNHSELVSKLSAVLSKL